MSEKLKVPQKGATERLRKLYNEILERPFSSELLEILKKKPQVPEEHPKKKIAKSESDAEIGSQHFLSLG